MDFGVGGFFGNTSQGTQTNDTSSQGFKRTATQSIRALMVNQVCRATLESDDGPVLIDEHEVVDAVLCVAFLHTREDQTQWVTVSDSTGVMDCKLKGNLEVTEDMLRQYNNLHGHFRVFSGKIYFDVTRIETQIAPLQSLYHEIEAAREWFHYSNLLPLGNSLDSVKSDGDAKPSADEALFVSDGNLSTELRGLITAAIDALSEESESTVPLIANSIRMSEENTKKYLDVLESEGTVYTAEAGVYHNA